MVTSFSLINFMKKISLKHRFVSSIILPTCEVVAPLQAIAVKPQEGAYWGFTLFEPSP
jgi:hypothetical protein